MPSLLLTPSSPPHARTSSKNSPPLSCFASSFADATALAPPPPPLFCLRGLLSYAPLFPPPHYFLWLPLAPLCSCHPPTVAPSQLLTSPLLSLRVGTSSIPPPLYLGWRLCLRPPPLATSSISSLTLFCFAPLFLTLRFFAHASLPPHHSLSLPPLPHHTSLLG